MTNRTNIKQASECDNHQVLVIVRGGVAEVFADDTVDIHVVDYDNMPEAEIPCDYQRLLRVRE